MARYNNSFPRSQLDELYDITNIMMAPTIHFQLITYPLRLQMTPLWGLTTPPRGLYLFILPRYYRRAAEVDGLRRLNRITFNDEMVPHVLPIHPRLVVVHVAVTNDTCTHVKLSGMDDVLCKSFITPAP